MTLEEDIRRLKELGRAVADPWAGLFSEDIHGVVLSLTGVGGRVYTTARF